MVCLLPDYAWIVTALAIGGSVLELWGVLLMSRRYLRVEAPFGAIISAIYGGENAKNAAYAAEKLTHEKALWTLQGLCVVAIGFFLSLVSNVLGAFICGA